VLLPSVTVAFADVLSAGGPPRVNPRRRRRSEGVDTGWAACYVYLAKASVTDGSNTPPLLPEGA